MKILNALCLMVFLSLFAVQTSYAEDNTIKWSPKTSVDKYHSFTIIFSEELDFSSVNSNTIIITKSNGMKVDVSFEKGKNNKIVIIKAPKEGYEDDTVYTLLAQNIKSHDGRDLNKKINMKFTTGAAMLSLSEVTLTSITETPNVPSQIQVMHNNRLEYRDVKWDIDSIETNEQENAFLIQGEVDGIDKKSVLKVVIDQTYISSLIANVTFQNGDTYGDKSKIIEFLMKELSDNKIQLKHKGFRDLVSAHLKGAQLQMAYKAFIREHLYQYFDRQDDTQAAIAGCLSDLMVDRAFLNLNAATQNNVEACLNMIFDYIENALGIKSNTTLEYLHLIDSNKTTNFKSFLSNLDFEVNGLTGTWFMKASNFSSIIIFKQDKKGKIDGDMYLKLTNEEESEFKHTITGQKDSNSIDLRFYYDDDYLFIQGIKSAKGKGDNYYFSQAEIDGIDSNGSLMGHYFEINISGKGGAFSHTNVSNSFTLIKVEDPGFLTDKYKYLKELRLTYKSAV